MHLRLVLYAFIAFVFFFKQKTAYEMRISDWSSDVCSSDLLLGLSPAAMVDALGNAGTQSSGLWQFLDTGAMSKHLHAGRAAEAGLLAADLAARGFSGPPQILEGEKGFFRATRSEEHTSELQSLMRISYAACCLKKKTRSNK